MNLFFKILILGFLVAVVFSTCKKPKKYSEIPEIKFLSFRLYDTSDGLNDLKMGILSFSFVDGDGDIGAMEYDTAAPLNTNLKISLYKEVDSAFQEVIFPLPINYTIPYLSASAGQNKTLKGEIRVKLNCVYVEQYKIVKYKFHILDRAQHKSNVDSTGEITLNP